MGLDGLDPDIVSRLLETGQLPNLARLRERGGLLGLPPRARPKHR